MVNNIVVVSGLPRSGTSMMMQILEAGGIEPLSDHVRKADSDNLKGYYELEKVKQLAKDHSFLATAGGKAVKIISELIRYLPQEHTYRVVFMLRNMPEVLTSQKKMLIARGKPTDLMSDEEMARLFEASLANARAWLAKQPRLEVIYISFNEIMQSPLECLEKINAFLGNRLDVHKMAKVPNGQYYRNRG
jgi:hypothetical protein